SMIPARGVRPPLVRLFNVGSTAPDPGIPPKKKDAKLPQPCPVSSRTELGRVRGSAATATQAFTVSMESKIESVNGGTAISLRVEKFNVPSALTWLLTASNNEASALRGPITRELLCKSKSERAK